MTTYDPYTEVSKLNVAFGNPLGDLKNVDFKRIKKQLACIPEELEEFAMALSNGDVNGMRDALCDVAVFAYGAMHLMGWSRETERHAWDYDISGDSLTSVYKGSVLTRASMMGVSEMSFAASLAYGVVGAFANLSDANDSCESTSKSAPRLFVAVKRLVDLICDAYAQAFPEYKVSPFLIDMKAVTDALWTRLCSTPDQVARTRAKYEAEGLTLYESVLDGKTALKVVKDFTTASGKFYPAHKFVKCVDFQEPVFLSVQELAKATKGE